MREIKFRGKRTVDGEWVRGYLIGEDVIVGNIVEWDNEYFITTFWHKVDPNLVGQFTGLKDKDGKEIYEGDILFDDISSYNYIVKFGEYPNEHDLEYSCYGWYLELIVDGKYKSALQMTGLLEVTGNIYDNLELLGSQ